ncbi:MAG: hypothetical protein HY569_00390 [Candidatus Magasanikbacteria bacterium]|nr:hypothetical protein [Candidatus Magasanikbacteria bacterium]
MGAQAVALGKTIFVVTDGGHNRYPDPDMTRGRAKIRRLRDKLPEHIEMVVCGTGSRHRQIAELLGITPTNFTILAGTADSEQKGKKNLRLVVFADGTKVPAIAVTDAVVLRDSVHTYVRNTLPHNTVVCASKSFLCALQNALGTQSEILPATVYEIDVDRGGHINITKL